MSESLIADQLSAKITYPEQLSVSITHCGAVFGQNHLSGAVFGQNHPLRSSFRSDSHIAGQYSVRITCRVRVACRGTGFGRSHLLRSDGAVFGRSPFNFLTKSLAADSDSDSDAHHAAEHVAICIPSVFQCSRRGDCDDGDHVCPNIHGHLDAEAS